MPKTEEELKSLKKRIEELQKELRELSDEELAQVTGGTIIAGRNNVKAHGESGGNGGANG